MNTLKTDEQMASGCLKRPERGQAALAIGELAMQAMFTRYRQDARQDV